MHEDQFHNLLLRSWGLSSLLRPTLILSLSLVHHWHEVGLSETQMFFLFFLFPPLRVLDLVHGGSRGFLQMTVGEVLEEVEGHACVLWVYICMYMYIYIYIYIHTGAARRGGGRFFIENSRRGGSWSSKSHESEFQKSTKKVGYE